MNLGTLRHADEQAKYRLCAQSYVTPSIGPAPLQELTPVRLNLLYAHLLAAGRVHRRGAQPAGLTPATVAVVHRMLHHALRDAVKGGYVARNVAEDAEPPLVGRRAPTVWTPERLRAEEGVDTGDVALRSRRSQVSWTASSASCTDPSSR